MATNLSIGRPQVVDEANPSITLGAEYTAPDGIRKYRFARAGTSALTVGNLLQGPAEDTGDQNIAATVAAIGATSIVTASMTVTANQYAGGYVTVSVTPGLGTTYRIKQHAAYTAVAATFELEEPLTVALTAASRLDFVANPYNGVIVNPTSASGAVVGVAVNDIAASQYGWIQVAGPANVLADAGGAVTVGAAVSASNQTAGAVENGVAAQSNIGYALTGIASNENGLVFLRIS